jgi:hypothetical protein
VTAGTAGVEPPWTVSTRWSILCGVHRELATVELSIVKQPNCLGRVLIGGKLDEGETPRGAGLSIGRQVHLDDVAGLGQKLSQGLRGRVSVQIPHEDTG